MPTADTNDHAQIPVTVMLPMTLSAPQRWTASWDGAQLAYTEEHDNTTDIQASLEMAKHILSVEVRQVGSNGVAFEYLDFARGHEHLLLEMVLQLESRGYLRPGSCMDVVPWLAEHRPVVFLRP